MHLRVKVKCINTGNLVEKFLSVVNIPRKYFESIQGTGLLDSFDANRGENCKTCARN
jgi:hypothetical protein